MQVMSRENSIFAVSVILLAIVMNIVMTDITAKEVKKRLLNIEGGINTQNFLLEEILHD